MRIDVVPDALTGGGGDLQRLGADVHGMASAVRSAGSGAAGACGFPDAAGALEDFAAAWSGALNRSGDGISGLGTVVTVAGRVYRIVDATAMGL
jgi:hypothetical protein